LVWNTIKQNLEFTEYFRVYGPFPYKGEKFEPSLWKGSDVEIVVKAETVNKISMKLFTVTSDVPVFTKDYSLQTMNIQAILLLLIYTEFSQVKNPLF